MILRPWQALGAFGLALVLVVAVWPRPGELAGLAEAAGAWGPASRLLERAHATRPTDDALTRRLLTAYERAGQRDKAMALLERQRTSRPLTPDERQMARRVGLALGEPRRVLTLLTAPGEKPAPDEAPALVDLALQAGDLVAARRWHGAWAARRPADPAVIARGRDLALAAGDAGGALAAQRRLLAVAPGREAAKRLCDLLVSAGKPGDALAVAEAWPGPATDATWRQEAVRLAEWAGLPARAIPHRQALYRVTRADSDGRSLLSALVATRHPQALATARALLAAHGHATTLRREAEAVLVNAGQAEAVLAARRDHVRRGPRDPDRHRALVDWALGRNRHDVALAELTRWVALRPDDVGARLRQAQVLVWAGRPDAARAAYGAVLAHGGLTPADERRAREAWLALTDARQDRTPTGIANLRRLLALGPERPAVRRRLAEALWALREAGSALLEARRLADAPGAPREDRLRLALWQLDAGQTTEAVRRLEALERTGGLPPEAHARVAYTAADAGRWREAVSHLERYVHVRATDARAWTALAWARERLGDPAGAIAAWRRKLALADAPGDRAHLADLLARRGQSESALALLDGPGLTLGARRLQLALASELKRPAAQVAAARAVVAAEPADGPAWVALAEGLAALDQPDAADQALEAALTRTGADRAVLVAAASRRLAQGRTEAAAPLLVRLAADPAGDPAALRLLAVADRESDPTRAARWLDALHDQIPGDAASWLLRGELATELNQPAVAREAYATAASFDAADESDAEAVALALERLGRTEAAVAAWRRLAAAHPGRAGPAVALARHALTRMEPDQALGWVARARAAAPDAREPRLLEAEAHLMRGEAASALPLVEALQAERPGDVAATALLARSQHAAGRYRQAHQTAKALAATRPQDAGLAALTERYRQDGGARVTAGGLHEASALVTRYRAETGATMAVGEQGRLSVALARLGWDADDHAEEAGLTGAWRAGPWALEGKLALATQAGSPQAPLGGVGMRWETPGLSWRAAVAEDRWEEAIAAVRRLGRERHATAEAAWWPSPSFGVRGHLDWGQATLDGASAGTTGTRLAEGIWRPGDQSPWSVTYQVRNREWGAAGLPVGLPESTTTHALVAGYAARHGAWRVEVRPGYVADTRGGHSPLLGGALGWSPTGPGELRLAGAWSPQGLQQGTTSAYERLELTGHWWF